MSNPESFIDEVTEEVRRDRLFRFIRRYGWIVILVIVAGVAGAGYLEWNRAQDQETAEQFGDALSGALETQDPAARAVALAEIGDRETGRRVALVDLLAAGDALVNGDRQQALSDLAKVATDASLPSAWRDLARLRQVALAGADMDLAERRATLDDLSRPGAPYRALALEQSALILVETGDAAGAVTALKALLQEPEMTPALRRRAAQLLVALGGQPDAG